MDCLATSPLEIVMNTIQEFLRLNVGFIIHETVGYSRVFTIEASTIQLEHELTLNDLYGTVKVTRTTPGLLIQVSLNAGTDAECVRCLENLSQPLEIEFTELYAFTADKVTESGLVVPENGIIDLEPLVRDEMLVAVPMNPLCRPDCKGLCPHCGENQNLVSCNHKNEETDSRFEILRSLIDNQ